MKKTVKALIFSFLLLTLLTSCLAVSAKRLVTVKLDGTALEFDVQPQIIDGRTMVPMRKIFESIGASVEWDDATRTITSEKDGRVVTLVVGVPVLKINGEKTVELDVAPVIVDGRTLVPLRAISNAFLLNVDWDDATSTVLLYSKPNVNLENFNSLKNILMTRGEYSKRNFEDGDYYEEYQVYKKIDDQQSMIISYDYWKVDDSITNSITFWLKSEYDSFDTTVMIVVYPDKDPSLLYEIDFITSDEYVLHARFYSEKRPYVISENGVPEYLMESACKLLNYDIFNIDVYIEVFFNVSLQDFGIYYEYDL